MHSADSPRTARFTDYALSDPRIQLVVPIHAQRVAEPELADSAPIMRHRKLTAIGWSQTAERLVAYLERRTPWDS